MNAVVTMQTRVEDYLAERRRLGYRLRSTALALRSFARYVDGLDLSAPLSVAVMAAWARQAKTNSDNPTTWARRLKRLRPFTRWLQQFEPDTEVPDSTVFGPIGWRPAPHIFTEQEIGDLLAGGSSLKEVADVLRHRSLDTTLIYAKLDSRNLSAVALPWPGGEA